MLTAAYLQLPSALLDVPCSICHIASAFADRRTALRETWMAAAPDSVIVKFVLYEKERNIDVQRESDLFHDIIFVQGGTTTDYRSIVYKTFAFIQVCPATQTDVECTTHSVMQSSSTLTCCFAKGLARASSRRPKGFANLQSC